MNITPSPRMIVPAALLLASAASLDAQNIDWGTWTRTGSALYANGDTITLSSLVNGSVSDVRNESASANVISDPSFPFANAPGIGQYGFFHNAEAAPSTWSMKIDLADFTLAPDSVIGFSNLDGRSLDNTSPISVSIVYLDSLENPVSLSSATFYLAAVGNAFFLTNLPANLASVVYTKTGPADYVYDSTLFYAGTAVPEPSGFVLLGVTAAAGILRRRRSAEA